MWLCNPNNPTGTYFNHDELESFLERVPSHVPVLIDEAQERFDNAFLLRTFSKAYGLAGLRVGYVVATNEAIEKWNMTTIQCHSYFRIRSDCSIRRSSVFERCNS